MMKRTVAFLCIFILVFGIGITQISKVKLWDTNLTYQATLLWNEAGNANYNLNFILGNANRTITLQGDPTLADWFDQTVKIAARPTFQGLTLGPESLSNKTSLIFKSYFDYPTNANPRVGGWITEEGTGTVAIPEAHPETRGTEFNVDTLEWINAVNPWYVLDITATKLYASGSAGQTIRAYNLSDGSLSQTSPNTSLINVEGLCHDSTHIYIFGFENGVGAKVKKYLLSDLSYVAQWSAAAGSQLRGGAIHGGNLYTMNIGSSFKYMQIITASTMASAGTVAWPEYTPGTKWTLGPLCIDDTGSYVWSGATRAAPAEDHTLKMNIADLSIVTDSGSVSHNLVNRVPFYYKSGTQARIFAGGSLGLTVFSVVKINPDTCLAYYASVSTTDESLGCVVDGTYVYVGIWDTGDIQRRLMNTVYTPDTEAGILRFWVNRLGAMTEVARLTSANKNLEVVGSVISEVAVGTAPFQPVSTTMCPNLNSDMVDGKHDTDLAPSNAKFIVQEAHSGLSAEQSLGLLTTGILKNTTTAAVGVLSIAVGADLPAHNLLSAQHGDTTPSAPADQNVVTWNAATSKWIAQAPPAAAPHGVLSATHNDSTAAAVVRGDMMIGVGATPKWTRVPTAAAGSYWASGVDPSWAALNQAAVAGLTTADSPTLAGLTLSGLTASVPVVTDASKALASVSYATFKSSLAIAQADVSEMTTADSPVFVNVKCSGLTDGYVPYHVSDAAGLANSGIRVSSGNNVGIGCAPTVYGATFTNLEISGSTYPYITLSVGATGTAAFFTSATNTVLSAVTAIPLVFRTTDLERMRILAGGPVLINATAAVGSEQFRVNGYVYIDANCSALSYTDRTPKAKNKEEAWAAILSMKSDGKGGIDHAQLHPFVRSESKARNPKTDKEETTLGRNMSAMLSATVDALQDVEARLRKLEKAVSDMKQRMN
jgi:hypothetical protein